jgi:hypothetical protein
MTFVLRPLWVRIFLLSNPPVPHTFSKSPVFAVCKGSTLAAPGFQIDKDSLT